MKTVIIYESMYGNTRAIADAIATGLGDATGAVVVPVGQARPELLYGADLVVVGAPTHVHGLSRAATRKGAADAAGKPGSGLTLEPGAAGPGLRDFFDRLGRSRGAAAAFDTRLAGSTILTGQASKAITRQLRQHGFRMVAGPESFLVTKDNRLRPGEQDRARDWGRRLSSKIVAMKVDATGHRG